MLVQITEKSKQVFEAAAKKLGLSNELPNVSMLREDLGLYITAKYMLAVIIEANKDGKLYDITNHDKRKYEPIHMADEGYVAGSGGGGFSYFDCGSVNGFSTVGARLSFNSVDECELNTNEHPDLWEIAMLDVR